LHRNRWPKKQRPGLACRGIAARSFERSFQFADYVEVKGASLKNGLLHVDFAREIPEAMKPRTIPSSRIILEVKPTHVAA
jgi:molecular chaperone IbpA